MPNDHKRKHDAARFWIEAARRLGFTDTSDSEEAKAVDHAFLWMKGRGLPAGRDTPHALIRFLYTFDEHFAGFIDDHVSRKNDTAGQALAEQLAATWPGAADFLTELKALSCSKKTGIAVERTLDLIRYWDAGLSSEDNIARHHLRMTTPKTRH